MKTALFALPAWNQAAFDAALAAFHNPTPTPTPAVYGVEEMAALRATMAEHNGFFNVSLVAVESSPVLAAVVVASPAFAAQVEATVIQTIGVTHWFDAPHHALY
jgi:hypothetical protein